MSQEQKQNETETLSRRRALKIIGVGAGAAGALPVLNSNALGQHHNHHGAHAPAAPKAKPAAVAPKFFTPVEMATITTMSEMIIPADDHSPGAKEAQVPAFIDMMVNESPQETKQLWRDGIAAVNRMSTVKFAKAFAEATETQQDTIMAEISRNEMKPNTAEEKFFRAIKNLTIDGYYTSEIGIHKDLVYQGNSYVKEYTGCTHPEHKA